MGLQAISLPCPFCPLDTLPHSPHTRNRVVNPQRPWLCCKEAALQCDSQMGEQAQATGSASENGLRGPATLAGRGDGGEGRAKARPPSSHPAARQPRRSRW